MQESWVTALIAVFAAFFALFAAFVLSRWLEPADSARRRRLENRIAPTSLLYRGEVLVDATPPARALLSRLSGTRLTTLLGWLAFEEGIDPWVIAGGALIIGAVSANSWWDARRARALARVGVAVPPLAPGSP